MEEVDIQNEGALQALKPEENLDQVPANSFVKFKLSKIQCIHLRLRLKVVSLIVNLAVKRIGGVRSRNVHVSLRIRTPQ